MLFQKFGYMLILVLAAFCLMGCPSSGNDGNDDTFMPAPDPGPIPVPVPEVRGPMTTAETSQAPGTAFTFNVNVRNVDGVGVFQGFVSNATGSVSLDGFPSTITFTFPLEFQADGSFSATGTLFGPLAGSGTVVVTVNYVGEGEIDPYCFLLGVGGVTGSGPVDCSLGTPPPPATENCSNSFDDDGDGLVDCDDPDCAASPSCVTGPFNFSGVYEADCPEDAGAGAFASPCATGVEFIHVIISHDPVAQTVGFMLVGPDVDDMTPATGCPIWTTNPTGLSLTLPVTLLDTGNPDAGFTVTFPSFDVMGECAIPFASLFTYSSPPALLTFTVTGGATPTAVLEDLGGTPLGASGGTSFPCPQGSLRSMTRISTTGSIAGLPFSYCP